MDERGGFLASCRVDIGIPGETEFADIAVGNLVERREALFHVAPAIGQPFFARTARDQGIGHTFRGRARNLVSR